MKSQIKQILLKFYNSCRAGKYISIGEYADRIMGIIGKKTELLPIEETAFYKQGREDGIKEVLNEVLGSLPKELNMEDIKPKIRNEFSITKSYIMGFNSCLSEVQSKIKELLTKSEMF